MATIRQKGAKGAFDVHQDQSNRNTTPGIDEESEDRTDEIEYGEVEEYKEMEESEQEQDLAHSQETNREEYSDSEESDGFVEPTVQDDMDRFQHSFKGIKERFRLINRIGEGTFSTVYKAEDLHYDYYNNDWDLEAKEDPEWTSPPLKRQRNAMSGESYSQQKRKPRYVAIKKIYVTSSPARIFNELDLLNSLRGCNSVCPLITAFRHTDQIVAILPYFRHTDFREYFRQMTIPDVKIYFRSLFTALAAVHEKKILHRDIKPTNFLYEPSKRRGVLVDFGLAERYGTDYKPCLCKLHPSERKNRIQNSIAGVMGPSNGYPKNDTRPSRRANRAGTRGFRAPEVLFKCTAQETKIDVWSAGVILLTILSKRFPFFNSADDVEAMIEIATIFGTKRMKHAAYLHGAQFETNIPTVGAGGFTLEKIILWSTCRSEGGDKSHPLTEEEIEAVGFLAKCLDLDPGKRISAKEALEHSFLREVEDTEDDEMALI